MELRKDPITRSWVITGDDVPDVPHRARNRLAVSVPIRPRRRSSSPTCPGVARRPLVGARRGASHAACIASRASPPAAATAFTTACARWARMKCWWKIPRHDRHLWNASDAEIEQFLLLAAQRIQDLKRDGRFKYVSIFKNHGASAGQEFEHPTSQLTATTFVPRRVLYELRAGREYFKQKERCVFCDIISQETQQDLRVLEVRGDFIALCPYAPRVPYETWILPRTHEAAFERFGLNRPGSLRDLGRPAAPHLAAHSHRHRGFPSGAAHFAQQPCTVRGVWVTGRPSTRTTTGTSRFCRSSRRKAKSYTFKEVYYSPVASETAVKRLREAKIEA